MKTTYGFQNDEDIINPPGLEGMTFGAVRLRGVSATAQILRQRGTRFGDAGR